MRGSPPVLLQGDCLDIMQVIPDKSIDLVVTSPPYDTMIYRKLTYAPLSHNRYEQEFEYMFVLSKGKPKTFNPIKIPCKYVGQSSWGKPSFYKTDDGELTPVEKHVIAETKTKGNIFEYRTGSTTSSAKIKHPAMFPLQLALDHVQSWSNPGDIVLDPFLGSGTTGVAAVNLDRDFIGIEKEDKYFKIAETRINNAFNSIEDKKEEDAA